MRSTLLLVGLLGCQSAPPVVESRADSQAPVVVPPAEAPPVGSHELPDAPDDYVGWLFDDTRIHQVDLTMELADAALLFDEPYEKVPGTAVIDGYDAGEIGIRLRGKLGSFQEIDEKPKFKLDFNFINSDRSFFGLKSMALNNSVADCSYTREKLAYEIYGLAGLVVPRVTWTQVTLNGEDYGLYQIVEFPDKPFLKRVMTNPDGNLYDGKYLLGVGVIGFLNLDFDETVVQMPLEEGVDVGHADVIAIAQAAHDGEQAGEWMAHTDPLVDWYSLHGMFAAEMLTEHWDGYAVGVNNYRVWIDADTGLMQLLPWDLDNSLKPPGFAWYDWDNPRSVLAGGCVDDNACRADMHDRLGDFVDVVEATDWDAKLDIWYDLIGDAAAADPRGGCGANEILNNQWDLRNLMNNRPAQLRAERNL